MQKDKRNHSGDARFTTGIFLTVGILMLAAGLFLGIRLLVQNQITKYQERKDAAANFSYGVKESDLNVTDIVWEDYPGWKTLCFDVEGTVTVWVPKDAEACFTDLNQGSLLEKNRESKILSDGKEQLLYDVVSYEIVQGTVNGRVTDTQAENEILKAINGYQWKVSWETEKGPEEGNAYTLGYVLPMGKEMQFWTPEQNRYAGRNLEVYLGAFWMSRTYLDETAVETKKLAEGISFTQYGEDIFCFQIENERNEDWLYYPAPPALELWYDGVWIELQPPYDGIAGNSVCKAGEKVVIEKPEIQSSYPYLMPGLYRLVVYGEDNECAISNVFEKK